MKIKFAIVLTSVFAVICSPLSAETHNSDGPVAASDRAPAREVHPIGFLERLFPWDRGNAENEQPSRWKLGPKASGAEFRRIRPNQSLIIGISGASPKQVDLGDACYRVDYDLPMRRAMITLTRGTRKEPPPLSYLPKFPGFGIVEAHGIVLQR